MTGKEARVLRDRALASGASTFIGSVCKKGHQPAERYTRTNTCVKCSKIKATTRWRPEKLTREQQRRVEQAIIEKDPQ